jgi:hypothetical protein
VTPLSELLNSQPLTARQAAARADELDVDLKYGTLAAYWAGTHGRPTAVMLSRLALVVPFSELRLQQAAWSTTAPCGRWTPPEESVLLDARQRKALNELIRTIVTRSDESEGAVLERLQARATEATEVQIEQSNGRRKKRG